MSTQSLFRNWPEIAKIKYDLLRAVLIGIDLETEEGERVQVAFPECFSEKQVTTAVPISVLKDFARDQNGGAYSHPEEMLLSTSSIGWHHLPYVRISLSRERFEEIDKANGYVLATSNEVDFFKKYKYGQGQIPCFVTFRGSKYVLVEKFDLVEELILVPAEAIDMTK